MDQCLKLSKSGIALNDAKIKLFTIARPVFTHGLKVWTIKKYRTEPTGMIFLDQ
jgi:hypothetical protein